MARMFLKDVGYAKNYITCLNIIKSQGKDTDTFSLDDIADKIDISYDSGNNKYFDKYFHQFTRYSKDAKFLWVDSGFMTREGKVLYIQYTATNSTWSGCFVGTEEALISEFQQNTSQDLLSKSAMANQGFILDIQSRLNSGLKTTFTTSTDICSYLMGIISRINNLLKESKDVSKYLIFNKSKTKVVFSTGLLDTYCNSILVMGTVGLLLKGVYNIVDTNLSVVSSKNLLVNHGFSPTDVNTPLYKVEFFEKSVKEYMFDANIEDFDLYNSDRFNHCVTDRLYRFPENIRQLDPTTIFEKVITAIQKAVAISKQDPFFILPNYSPKEDNLSFIIPFFTDDDFSKQPQMGIVVYKYSSGLWQIMTVLTREQVLRSRRLISPMMDLYFKRETSEYQGD